MKVLVIFIIFIFNGNCFNIDTRYPIVYFYNNTQLNATRLLKNTHFGYSVILNKGITEKESWIQIGAPKSNDTNNNYFEPGAVFRCPINEPCKLFPLDASEEKRFSRPVNIGRKQYQPKKDEAWIGGAMDIDMKNNRVAVCGHRWVNNRTYGNLLPSDYRYHITGACYWSKTNENATTELLPITGFQDKWYSGGFFFHSTGQAGTSVHMPYSNTPELMIGAPGVSNWKGSVINYRDGKDRSGSIKAYNDFFISEAKDTHTFSYFGYSLSSGYFSLPNKLQYVASAPRAELYKGKITVYDVNSQGQILTAVWKQGTMTGEYFGAAIAVADINGDRLDDIIVGAPRHSIQMDEGKIYIYYGHYKSILRQPSNLATINGQAIGGQFGSAVQSLGDINSDGYEDIAVGAPYENENHGAVYIYNGQEKGDSLRFSQKIEGKNIYPLIKGFGISISRPADVDDNHISDIAIGSYLSENAILLRSRPVVSLKTKKKGKNLNLERNSTTFQIEICLSYSGKYIQSKLNVIRKIKMDENNRRVSISNNNTKQVEDIKEILLNARQDNCENVTFHLSKTTNYLDPIIIIVSQDIQEYSGPSQPILINQHPKSYDGFCKHCPIVNDLISTKEIKIVIPYTLNCGSDNICETDLMVKAQFLHLGVKNEFIIGSQSYVSLNITISNKKEDAYLTQIEVKLPENINLQEVPTNCNEDVKKVTVITCDIDNPLKANASKSLLLNFDMSFITNSSNKFLSFDINTKSKSNELNYTDNSIVSYLNLTTNAFIDIKGNPEKNVYYYQNKTKLLNSTHLYKIQKTGVSPLDYFKLNISIPVLLMTYDGPQSFLTIFPPLGIHGDETFSCNWEDPYNTIEENVQMLEEIDPKSLIIDIDQRSAFPNGSERSRRSTEEQVKMKNSTDSESDKMFIVPINNKVLFVNCSTANVICKNLTCEIGPFHKKNVASLLIKMVLNMTILEKYVFKKDKNVIYLSTDGHVTEIAGKRYANTRISNVFLQEPVAQKVALWIITVSIIAGILILLLIILGLVKAGFFKRKAKEELEALKQQEVEKDFEIIKECDKDEMVEN